jgi:Ca2+-binding EF-hand superfamily protein
MKTIIALSSAIALSLAANITVAQSAEQGASCDRAQMCQARIQAKIERCDTNGDGQITLNEVQNQRAEHFGQMDADGNGFASAEELESFKAQMREQYQNQEAQTQCGHRKHRGQGRGGFGKGNRHQRLDNDGDGQISRDEFINNVPMFDRFDANNDGILTQEELAKKCERSGRGYGRR